MEITLFMETVIQELSKRFSGEVRITTDIVNNVYEFIVYDVKNKVTQGIIIDSFYKDYIQTNDLDGVIDDFEGVIRALIIEASEMEEEWQADQKYFSDFNNIKDSVYYRLIYKQIISDDFIHEDYLDMTKQYYVFYKSPGIFVDSYMSIQREYLEMWNITEEELKTVAEENMQKQPVEIKKLIDILGEMMPKEEYEKITDVVDADKYEVYVMQNTELKYGASAMCNKAAIRSFAEEIGEDIFIIPCSIHEVMMVVNNGNDAEFEKMAIKLEDVLYDMNCNVLPPEHVLADSIYIYKKETDTIEIV